MNPKKSVSIKLEVENLLKDGFIYPVLLTEWVSNPIPVNKKQGTILVYIEFRDLNLNFPKDNYPTPFIDQIIDKCAGNEIFSFMDGFYSYKQIQIKKEDQHKKSFIYPWGTFAYRKIPFGLKKIRDNFQRAILYDFHDIKKIVEVYLDDLKTKYRRRVEHCAHSRVALLRCRQYNIRLNPHKCIFFVESGRLLGFVVSKDGI